MICTTTMNKAYDEAARGLGWLLAGSRGCLIVDATRAERSTCRNIIGIEESSAAPTPFFVTRSTREYDMCFVK